MGSMLILCLLQAWLVRAELTRQYDRTAALSKEANLSWSFDREQKTFSFGLHVVTANVSTGDAAWVGIGVGEQSSGSMLGADILTAQFEKDVLDNCTTTNRHVPFTAFPIGEGNDNVFPVEDRCQSDRSWKLVSCTRDPNKRSFTLEVVRPMEATTDQDRAIGAGAQPMMYAYGVAGGVAYHHANRATKRVILVDNNGSYPATNNLVLPDDITKSFTVQAGNYVVPNVSTTYACRTQKFNLAAGEKLQMVAVENIIGEKAHHFIVYGCEDNEFTRSYSQMAPCNDGERRGSFDPRAKCGSVMHVWAAGRGPFILPENVGFPIDEGSSMIMLEVHYDNPTNEVGVRDDSGVKLHFATNRTVEAGTLQLMDGLVTMGGEKVQNDFNYTSTCPSACTNAWTDDKINVFAGFSHMHTTGKYMWTNRYDADRNFLQTLTSVAFFSNDHQAGLDYSPPLEVRKGDILSTTCNYDTTKRPDTVFGIETKDEMCIDFLWYYPAQRGTQTASNNFYCGMFRDRRQSITGTLCGSPFNNQSFDLKAINPSLNDLAGFSDSFGDVPATCPAALAGAANRTAANGAAANESVCFPAGARVYTKQRGEVTMAQLRIGDEVEVGAGEYSSVYIFTHREESKMYEFVELATESGARLRLTAGHFVYADGVLKRADEVRVGESVRDRDNRPSRVSAVGLVVDKGLYNPQTLHGDIVVEGVVASTYTHTFDRSVAHAMLAPMRAAHGWLGTKCAGFEKDDHLVMRLFRFVRRWAMSEMDALSWKSQ